MISASPKSSHPHHQSSAQPSDPITSGLQALLLAGASGLLVARLFMTPESAFLGDSLPVALTWFFLWGVWGCWRIRSVDLPVRFTTRDLAALLICAGQVLSALLVWSTSGDQRAAINLLWEWLALAAAYVILSSLAENQACRQIITRALLCALVASAVYGIWQHHVWYASMARQYVPLRQELDRLEQSKTPTQETQLRALHARKQMSELGVDPGWIAGPGRSIFENRLLQSREALGRCSLANTFAGFLLCLWIPTLGLLLQTVFQRKNSRFYLLLLGEVLLFIVVTYALLLTKSRTAYFAALLGGGVITLAVIRQAVPSFHALMIWLGAASCIIGPLIGIAWISGGIDAETFSEAPKSLQYRAEYWWSASQVVWDHPLFGVGPGNFRPYYLRYKLPQSSEEIADPHNLFLDVWASGGLLAFIGLLGLAAIVFIAVLKLFFRSSETPPLEPQAQTSASPAEAFTWSFEESLVLTGSLAILGIMFLSTGGFDLDLGALIVGWLLLMIFPWPIPRQLDLHVVVPCLLLAVSVHLLGAGGANMPGFLQPLLWFLLLLEVPPLKLGNVKPKTFGTLSLAFAAISFGACLRTAYIPVAMSRLNLEQAETARNADLKLKFLREACAAEPWSTAPWDRLASAYYERWYLSRSEQDFEALAAALRHVLSLDPHTPGNYRHLGEIYIKKSELEQAHPDRARVAAQEAATYFSQAVARYPYRADLLADWANAASQANDSATARTAARRALAQEEVNRRYGHTDKYLTPEELQKMQHLAADASPNSKTP